MQPKRIATISIVAVLAIAAGAFTVVTTSGNHHAADAPASTPETSEVRTTNLVERVETKAKLNHGKPVSYGTQLTGTLTSISAPGTKLTPGTEMMRVDDRPVFSMRGEIPAWRAFEPGMSDGRDVMQLEQNLAELGYFSADPDEHYGSATASAIAEWNHDNQFGWSNTIEFGRVVFVPTDMQVSAQKAAPGDPASAAVLEATGTAKMVTAEIDPSMRGLLPVGATTDIRLPDGNVTQGVVSAVDPAVEHEEGSGQQPKVKVPVRLTLNDASAVESLSDVTVTVVTVRTIAEQVLAVPIRALLAEPGGGYAVEVIRDGTPTRVPVEVGAFANSMVEITGGEIRDGDRVVVGE